MLKWQAWAMMMALVVAGYVGWQSYFEEHRPQSALERTQLVLENATISRFEGNGTPREQLHFKSLHYFNQESALAQEVRGYRRAETVDDFHTERLRYEPKRLISETPISMLRQNQHLHAQAARYELESKQLYLTQPVIDYVP